MEADTTTRPERLSFALWLDVMAPIYARLYLRHPPGGYHPMYSAIFDLRAAMVYDANRDNDCDRWDVVGDIWQQARTTLASFGLLMPRAVFDAVWRLYSDAEADPDPIWHRAFDVWQAAAHRRTDDDLATARLLEATRDVLRRGPACVCRVRYGFEPD